MSLSIILTYSSIQPPVDIVCIPHQPLNNVAPQAIDFLHLTELLWTGTDNLPGFETTMEDQVGQALDAIPYFV